MFVCSINNFVEIFFFGVGIGIAGLIGSVFVIGYFQDWWRRKK